MKDTVTFSKEAARLVSYGQLRVTTISPEAYRDAIERLNQIAGAIPGNSPMNLDYHFAEQTV